MNVQVLLWKWGLPGCDIQVVDDVIVAWSGCQIPDAPTNGQYEDAEDEYDAYIASLALGEPNAEEWRRWVADDLDEGTETLLEWDAPSVDAAWKVHGRIKQGANAVAFEAMLHLTCTTDEYGNLVRTVDLAVQSTSTSGDVSGIAWVDGSDNLYSDYDAASGKIRLRADFPSDNWSARGKWQRLDAADEIAA